MSGHVDAERVLDVFLAPEGDELPDRVLEAALAEIDLTPQRRGPFTRAPRRTSAMNKLAALAAAGIVLAVGAFAITRPPSTGPVAASPPPSAPVSSITPSQLITPSPATTPGLDVPGLIAFSRVAGGNATIMVSAPDGTGMANLISGAGNNVQPAWSPDGSQIAWASSAGIQVAAADGRNGVRVTDDGRDRDPAWSPDGAFIVFASNRDGDFEIYAQSVQGGELRQLTDNDVDDVHPSWSAAGEVIVFASDRAGTRDLWTMDPTGEHLGQLTLEGGVDDGPAWSPDGSRIAFASNRDGGAMSIHVMNADGSGLERVTSGSLPDQDPAWSPDGRYIAFARSGSGTDIAILDLVTQQVVNSLSQERAEFNYPSWRQP